MVAERDIYSVDSSSLMQAWQPALWASLEGLIDEGRLIASMEVYYELQRKHDELAEWAKKRKEHFFIEIDEELQALLRGLMARYPRLVDTKTGKSGADPFVIALAQRTPKCLVVSDERGGSARSPKIPFVCRAENLPCLSVLQMIEREGWRF